MHEAALDLALGADVLIHDAQHLAAELPDQSYLGHAYAEYPLNLAAAAGLAALLLFHHSPDPTEDALDTVCSGLAQSPTGCPCDFG